MGIPKTIDNDIPLIDSSFGFNTSCEVAARMIEASYVEATNAQNGVGLVKLMGRYPGIISRNATLANGNVDLLARWPIGFIRVDPSACARARLWSWLKVPRKVL